MMKNEILRALRESEGYLSGQELCKRLHVSRTAVWKNIQALRADGYEIEAVTKRGYRLTGIPDSIAEEEVASRLATHRFGSRIRYFSRIDSTNRYARQIAEEGAEEGTLVIADEQTAGRGRGGRHWVTPPRESIAFSLILRPSLSPDHIAMVTLVMGLAVVKAANFLYGSRSIGENDMNPSANRMAEPVTGTAQNHEAHDVRENAGFDIQRRIGSAMSDNKKLDIQCHTGFAPIDDGSGITSSGCVRVEIKWPNDAVVNGKKISGTLTEMSAEVDTINYIVVGTGINANLSSIPEEIQSTATSLRLELGREVNRAELIAQTMYEFESLYEMFERDGDLRCMVDEYNSLCVNNGRMVHVLDPAGDFTGIARGINTLGELVVIEDDGTLRKVYAGEVSVRGIYGYV